MLSLNDLQKSLILPHIRPGTLAADFTMGNGNDTLWLSRQIGPQGCVYAFDIQPMALENTRKRLAQAGAPDNCRLLCISHHLADQYIPGRICAGIFNLGYLPGADKTLTTKRQTTLEAIRRAIALMDQNACLLIAVYPGHEEGRLEGEAIERMLAPLPQKQFSVGKFRLINSPSAPYFYLIEN